MAEEIKWIVATLRYLADKTEHSLCSNGDVCDGCPVNKVPIELLPYDISCEESCPGYIMEKAADMIEERTEVAEHASTKAVVCDTALEEAAKLEEKLAWLLSYITHGRYSKTTYSITEMKSFVDDACCMCSEIRKLEADSDAWKRRAEAAERDIAVACDTCKHEGRSTNCGVCVRTFKHDFPRCWEWRYTGSIEDGQ